MAESSVLAPLSSQTSFTTESSPAFETPPPSNGLNRLNIVHCQGKHLIFYPNTHDDNVKFKDWWDNTLFRTRQTVNEAKFH